MCCVNNEIGHKVLWKHVKTPGRHFSVVWSRGNVFRNLCNKKKKDGEGVGTKKTGNTREERKEDRKCPATSRKLIQSKQEVNRCNVKLTGSAHEQRNADRKCLEAN